MNDKNKIIIALTVIVIAGGYLVYRSPLSKTENNIKIGAIFPLSGVNASYGEQASQAIKLALEDINKNLDRKIEVIYEDSEFKSDPALNAYQKLKLSGIRFFLTIGSQVASTIGPKAKEDGNLNYELTAVTPKYRDNSPFTCRSALTADVSSKVISDYLKSHHLIKIATLTTKDEQGLAVEQTIADDIKEFSGQIIDKENYQLGDTDLRTQITKIKSVNPDALILIAPGKHAEIALRQLKELNFSKPIFSNNFTIKNQDLKDLSLAQGIIFSDYAYEGAIQEGDSEKLRDLKERFKQLTGQDLSVAAVNAYDAVSIVSEGIKEKGNDPEKVAQYITSLKNYPGMSGQLSFDQDCEAHQAAVLRLVHDNQFQGVK